MQSYNFELSGTHSPEILAATQKLLTDLEEADFGKQFWHTMGRVAELGQENGEPKLDWVNGLADILAHPDWLDGLLAEASEILAEPIIKHIVWSGMGGSVMTLHCLEALGLLDNARFSLHILDSTDPAQLNQLLQTVAQAENLALEPANLPAILDSMLMLGVSMGMTSEEPITHLRWFTALLKTYQLAPANHLRVLTLPHSYLHNFADEYSVKRLNLQLDGSSNTPGRMSAPTTKVFLLPLALQLLALAHNDAQTARQNLQLILQTCQNLYLTNDWGDNGSSQVSKMTDDPFVRLGATIAAYASQGRNKVILRSQGDEWRPLWGWTEQIVEESLGKGGKGFLIFYDQHFDNQPDDSLTLDINSQRIEVEGDKNFQFVLPQIADATLTNPVFMQKMIVTAAFFANFKKTVVTFAYLHDIVFAGQPAVEGYKRYAREIREGEAEVELLPATNQYQVRFGNLVLDYAPLIKSGLVLETELSAEMLHLSPAAVSRSTENAPLRYATLNDRRKLLKLMQVQMAVGIVSGEGLLEIAPEGDFGLLRQTLTSEVTSEIYVGLSQLQRYSLRNGDYIEGKIRPPHEPEKYYTLVQLEEVNGLDPEVLAIERRRERGGAAIYAALLSLARQKGSLGYADITYNGVPSPAITALLEQTRRELFNGQLKMPAKLRQGPQDYHSTEQSETDGPPELLSLRLVAASHEPILAGEYSDRFLLAQALGTVAAMQEARRWVLLLVLPDTSPATLADLQEFFQQTGEFLQ